MTPFVGSARVCGLPLFTYGFVTVMLFDGEPLKRIVVLPSYLRPPDVRDGLQRRVRGRHRERLDAGALGPLNTGSPAQLLPPTLV